jgi:hypothetical protein
MFPIRVSRPHKPGRSRAAPVRTAIVPDVAMGALAMVSLRMYLLKHNWNGCAHLHHEFKYNF